jgi:hypothetical protein
MTRASALLWIAVAVYGPIAIHNTVKSQHDLQPAASGSPEPSKPSALNEAATPAPPAARPILPEWSVLQAQGAVRMSAIVK